jgi:methanogenic corrinoid protein MtbC1
VSWPIFKLPPLPVPERSAKDELARIVECEIIPRLVMANQPQPCMPAPAAVAVARDTTRVLTLGATVVEAFTRSVLARTADSMEQYVEALLQDGITETQTYFQLLAPSARLLVDLWGEDKISYLEVTVSLNRLQHLVHAFTEDTPYNGNCEAASRSALFAPSPGGQHTFGFYLMEEMFRWSGWKTWVEIDTDNNDVGAKTRCHWFDAVCLNVTREADIEAVSATIDTVRRMSRNGNLHVLAYGSICVERPSLVAAIGAHAAASNANEALSILDHAMTRPAIE